MSKRMFSETQHQSAPPSLLLQAQLTIQELRLLLLSCPIVRIHVHVDMYIYKVHQYTAQRKLWNTWDFALLYFTQHMIAKHLVAL